MGSVRPCAPSAALAAFHPHAPWTPPPGWAEALARNRDRAVNAGLNDPERG
jgi:hypothetical protein